MHNAHTRCNKNPIIRRETNFQIQVRINIWCGIIDNLSLGPYLYSDILNGIKYLEFLNTKFENYWEKLPLSVTQDMYF